MQLLSSACFTPRHLREVLPHPLLLCSVALAVTRQVLQSRQQGALDPVVRHGDDVGRPPVSGRDGVLGLHDVHVRPVVEFDGWAAQIVE